MLDVLQEINRNISYCRSLRERLVFIRSAGNVQIDTEVVSNTHILH